jgi:hypothetical protein
MFGMLSVLAELQRELIVANTNDGLASAALAQQLYDAREKTVQQIADLSGVPGRRCTDTSTQTTPRPASRRRPLPRSPDGHLEIILGWIREKRSRAVNPSAEAVGLPHSPTMTPADAAANRLPSYVELLFPG